MIEGGSSRNYVNTKKMMYSSPAAWDELMGKLVSVVSEYAAEQVRAGADVIQIFDSWVGCLSVDDYRRYVCLVPPNWCSRCAIPESQSFILGRTVPLFCHP